MTNGQIPWDAQSGDQPAAGADEQQMPQNAQSAAQQAYFSQPPLPDAQPSQPATAQYGQPDAQSFGQPPMPQGQPAAQPFEQSPLPDNSQYQAPAPQEGYYAQPQAVDAQGYSQQDYPQQYYQPQDYPPQQGYPYPQQDYPQQDYSQQYYAQPAPAAAPGYGAPYGTPYPSKPKTNTLAIVGFVCSFLISIVGLILCIVAKNQIKTSGERGDGLATAGIIISIVWMVLSVVCNLYLRQYLGSAVLLPMSLGFLS